MLLGHAGKMGISVHTCIPTYIYTVDTYIHIYIYIHMIPTTASLCKFLMVVARILCFLKIKKRIERKFPFPVAFVSVGLSIGHFPMEKQQVSKVSSRVEHLLQPFSPHLEASFAAWKDPFVPVHNPNGRCIMKHNIFGTNRGVNMDRLY